MNFLWGGILFFHFCFHLSICNIASVSLVINGFSTYMYNTSGYSELFISNNTGISCKSNNLFTYYQSGQDFANNSPYILNITGSTVAASLSISTQYGIISPNISMTSCTNNCSIQIWNNCPNSVNYFNYFDIIVLNIQGMQTFSYNILCNRQFGTSTFQAGLFLIIIFSVLVVILTSVFARAWAFYNHGIQIMYPYIFTYNISEFIGGIILLFAPNAAQIIGDVIIWFFGIFGIVTSFNQILFLLKMEALSKTLINIKQYGIRITDIITFFIALGLLLTWILDDKNWIVNDIISYCVIIATLKVFKITSLKKIIIFYAIQLSIEVMFVILIDVLQKVSYEDYLLNDFNNPLEIQLPTINPVYGLKCSWLPISAVILPGLLISYLRRFDNSRHTNIYLITSSISFASGSILWVVISVLSPRNMPFQLIAEPLMIILVCLFAYTRKQLRILWNGKFYDPQFKNQEEQEEGKFSYEMQARKFQIKQNFMDGLKIDKDQDSQIESNEQSKNEGQIQNFEQVLKMNEVKKADAI